MLNTRNTRGSEEGYMMRNNIREQFTQGNYANAKNIASYFAGEAILGAADWGLYYLAQAASALGDYYIADEIFRYFLCCKPDFAPTAGELERNAARRRLCKPPQIAFFDGLTPYTFPVLDYEPLVYDDGFPRDAFRMLSLRGTAAYHRADKKAAFFELIRRLAYSFPAIEKPIAAYLIPSTAVFDDVFEKTIKPFSAYAAWVWTENMAAVGFYDDPSRHTLFFDAQFVERNIVKNVGTITHELAHLEQNDSKLRERFHSPPLADSGFKQTENKILNERLTDLQVIAKGYGYELHCDRRNVPLHCITNFDQADVLKMIDAASRL